MHIHPPHPHQAPTGRVRRPVVAAGVTAVLLVGGGAAVGVVTPQAAPTVAGHLTTTPVSTTPATGTAVTAKVFVVDVQRFASMLQAFGNTLQKASVSDAEMRRLAPHMRRQLVIFDRVTTRMAGYTVDTPALERKRAAMVEAAPPVSHLGRQLITASLAGENRLVHRTSRALVKALHRLLVAAKA